MNNINVTTGSIVSSTLNLNTSLNSMRKEQLLRLLTVNVSTALNMAKLVKFEHNNVLLEVFGKFIETITNINSQNNIYQTHNNCNYTAAETLSIRSGTFKTEKLILLRSPNEKPVMQAAFYETEKNLAPNTFGDGKPNFVYYFHWNYNCFHFKQLCE